METIRLRDKNVEEAAARAADVLRAEGVVLYPTDTLYGLGADAFSDEAVGKIYAIKGRDEKKPVHCIVADLAMAAQYAELNDVAKNLAEKFLPGALTLILKKKEGIVGGIAKSIDTIGIRIPRNDFCLSLARQCGKPFTTTSANLAGMTPERSVDKIIEQLGGKRAMIDLIIDVRAISESKPSTVVDVSSGEIKILREGAISSQAILGN